jgi:uncharacterized protein YoxC
VSELRSCAERNDRLEKEVKGLLSLNKELEEKTRSIERDLNDFKTHIVRVVSSSVD